jgi:hypothetical protein
VLRYAPWALALLAVLALQGASLRLAAEPDRIGQTAEAGGLHANTPTACPELVEGPTPDPAVCTLLADLSARAAALTGSLALVDAAQRPARAGVAAGQVRDLVGQAAGTQLAGVLTDLADSLERFAAGDPAALAGVRSASERNARLRTQFQLCGGQE